MERAKAKRRAGFTLVELLLVISILLVLGTISVVGYTRIQKGTDKKLTLAKIQSTRQALKLYYSAMREWPSEEAGGLGALFTRPDDEDRAALWGDGGGPFLEEHMVPTDSWGIELKYEKLAEPDEKGHEFRLYSFGPNKQDDSGTGDDIPNWAEEQA